VARSARDQRDLSRDRELLRYGLRVASAELVHEWVWERERAQEGQSVDLAASWADYVLFVA